MPTSTSLYPIYGSAREQRRSGCSGTATGIFGREAEWAHIERFLDGLVEGPHTLLIEGDAGIGKSTLWDAGAAVARHRGFSVLSCRALQSEASLIFTHLSDLLAPVPDACLADLPAPQLHALNAARLRSEGGSEPPGPRAVAGAALGALRKLAAGAPVLIAVDDWPWLDRASAAVLEYALRRVTDEPVGLLATARSDDAPEACSRLERSLAPRPLERLAVEALDLGAFGAMVECKGASAIRGPELMRLHVASGGNPLFGLELLAALADRGSDLPSSSPLPRPFPLPASARPLLRRRLATVPASVRQMVLALAAAPRPTVELCVTVCGDRRHAENALDIAEAAGILEVMDEEVRFTHPLLRSLAYSGATQRQRRSAHLSLAEASEPEERMRHQALAADCPDASLASELDTAADAAHERGAAQEACELSDLALGLTPPAHCQHRFRRLMAAGRHHLSAFDPDGAKRVLE